MVRRFLRASAITQRHGLVGLLLILLGEALILIRFRPFSDFYFPCVWLGYILFLDAATARQIGHSLYLDRRRVWLAMFPLSAVFWWIFELFNERVHNWVYVGAGNYSGLGYVVTASIDFSTVLPAVWTTALFILSLLPTSRDRGTTTSPVPRWVLGAMLAAGVLCLILPLAAPRYAYGLVWGCLYLLLDPINYRLGRPAIIAAVWHRKLLLPLSFALGALMCGFFWEAWNFWSMPKWRYNIPYVGFWHIFEMPLLGWSGYLPFGLEVFAMTNFVLPAIRLGTLTLAPRALEGSDRERVIRVS